MDAKTFAEKSKMRLQDREGLSLKEVKVLIDQNKAEIIAEFSDMK